MGSEKGGNAKPSVSTAMRDNDGHNNKDDKVVAIIAVNIGSVPSRRKIISASMVREWNLYHSCAYQQL